MADTIKQFKALANKNRLAIFEYLRQKECVTVTGQDGVNCDVGGIAEQFDLALSTVSHHLRVLHEAGLIQCEQRGKYTYCGVNREAVEQLREFLGDGETAQGEM